MAQDSLVGKDGKVTIGTSTILGMGTWEIGGASIALLDDTEFGDDYDDVVPGLITGGTVSFSGIYKKDDATGQDALREAFFQGSEITDLRFYVDETSYYAPNATLDETTGGGGLPTGVPVSHIVLTSEPSITMDRNDLGKVSFSGRVVGAMYLH